MRRRDVLGGFVRPLVAGGALHVGRPLDEAAVIEVEAELAASPAVALEIDAAREAVVAELVVRPPPMALGGEELRLACAVHDLLVLEHPAAERWFTGDARARVAAEAAALAAVPAPGARHAVLARHGLLHNLFDLERVDTHLAWWTGKATFRGEEPPRRLTRWSGMRRVRHEHVTLAFHEIVSREEDAERVVGQLCDASPLTDLLHPARAWPAFHWRRSLALLGDAELARAAAYGWLDGVFRGAEPAIALRPVAAGALAWRALVDAGGAPEDVRTVTAFLVHLAALVASSEAERGLAGESALIEAALPAEAPAEADGGEAAALSGAALFVALPDIVEIAEPALARPPGLDEDEALAARWRAHRKQVRAVLGTETRTALAAALAARLGESQAA